MNICAHPSGTSTSAVLAFMQKSLLFRKDHSSEMRNSEQFGSTITIHVPSPTSFSRQDVASSGTQVIVKFGQSLSLLSKGWLIYTTPLSCSFSLP